MKIKCEYCGTVYEDTLKSCPSCGAANNNRPEDHDKDPDTIEGLKKWYSDHNLPPYETTRFFIGVDYRHPKAFGIYKDETSGEYVVYKNKADGSRVVRYKGNDEAYAVNELLTKLKDEILKQKIHSRDRKSEYEGFHDNGSTGHDMNSSSKRDATGMIIKHISFYVISMVIIAVIVVAACHFVDYNGYYDYGNTVYYRDNIDWYYYDDDDDVWKKSDNVPSELKHNKDDYYVSDSWNSDVSRLGPKEDVTDSSVYENNHEDDDYDWDSGDSWDSGSTDWDSDW